MRYTVARLTRHPIAAEELAHGPFANAELTAALEAARIAVLVPLILVGAGPLAAFLKIYAIVPIALTLRWRALLVTVALLLVTAPLLPWVHSPITLSARGGVESCEAAALEKSWSG